MASRQTGKRETMPVMNTEWEPDLRKSAAAHKRAKTALKRAREDLDKQMATAAQKGASLRDIGKITSLNHETIRTAISRVEQQEDEPAEA